MATVEISAGAWSVVGLDDMGRYPELERKWKGRTIYVTGPDAAIQDLTNELYDRATEGDGGYDHSPAEKTIARRAVKLLKAQGFEARK